MPEQNASIVNVHRLSIKLQPKIEKVIARFFKPGSDQEISRIIQDVLNYPDEQNEQLHAALLEKFSTRHRHLVRKVEKYYDMVAYLVPSNVKPTKVQQHLIGAYCGSEYSIEAAALFNPSIVPHPDQTGLPEGSLRFVLSLRAVGEGHISSIVFRSGVIDCYGEITIDPSSPYAHSPAVYEPSDYLKSIFIKYLEMMEIEQEVIKFIFDDLPDIFIHEQLDSCLEALAAADFSPICKRTVKDALLYLARSKYDFRFNEDTDLSERVIFPGMTSPIYEEICNGIEDARFVLFTDDDGSHCYYATYTAYNGRYVLPKLLYTKDFVSFKMMPLSGHAIRGKGMALFPRKIKGQYVMLSRQDVNNNIMFSDNPNIWNTETLLNTPQYPWESLKVGNCGSPIETQYGWVVITHGVGLMREYCLGAMMLDLDDPRKVIGRLESPLLMPNAQEREGYVPNVLYACGAILKGDQLFISYAASDHHSALAMVYVEELWSAMKK